MNVFMSTPTSSLQQIWFSDPQTYTQALKYDHRAEWELAIMEEIESLLKNETWTLHTLPPGHNLVINKWVFKINVKSYGTIEQSKAHLVAKGFTHTYGMDYQETFAPTTCTGSIKIILSIVGVDDLYMVQFDIKTANLNSTIQELVFMTLLHCLRKQNLWRVVSQSKSHLVVGARFVAYAKAHTALNNNNMSWHKTFSYFLKEYDLIQSIADPCILYSTSSPRLILALWVDDGLAMCRDKSLIAKMITYLKTKFEVAVGDPGVYVGLHVIRDLAHWILYADQQHCTETMLTKFGYHDVNPVSNTKWSLCSPLLSTTKWLWYSCSKFSISRDCWVFTLRCLSFPPWYCSCSVGCGTIFHQFLGNSLHRNETHSQISLLTMRYTTLQTQVALILLLPI